MQGSKDLDSGCAVVFPGQGCQKIGMAHDFYSTYPQSRRVFERASEALGLNIAEICFSPNALIDLTEYTQPAILTSEIAIYSVLEDDFKIRPKFFAGHSLGEYTALVAAGVIDLEDAVRIVRSRGARMQAAVAEGSAAMAALILEQLPQERVREICDGMGCDVANYNSPAQLVISGSKETVQRACEALASELPQMRIIPLNVSAAFHSRLMQPIELEFRNFLSGYSANFKLDNAEKVLSNCTGTFHKSNNLIDSLVRQISMPVRWIENMELIAKVSQQVYEVGPQRVLGKFFSSLGVTAVTITDIRTLNKNFRTERTCEA